MTARDMAVMDPVTATAAADADMARAFKPSPHLFSEQYGLQRSATQIAPGSLWKFQMQRQTDTAPLNDSSSSYGLVSRLNHWIVAAAMIGMLVSGLVMAYGPFERETVFAIMGWHKAIGVLVLAYGIWRVGWRVVQGFIKQVSVMPRWQAIAAKVTHWGLLVVVLAMPLSGLVMTIYRGREVDVFGLIIPAQNKIEWLANAAGLTHQYVAWTLVGLLVLHIGGALKHHFIDSDMTLRRMGFRAA